jgi:hypothetical protein
MTEQDEILDFMRAWREQQEQRLTRFEQRLDQLAETTAAIKADVGVIKQRLTRAEGLLVAAITDIPSNTERFDLHERRLAALEAWRVEQAARWPHTDQAPDER